MYKYAYLNQTGINGLYYDVRMTAYTHVELHLTVVSHNVIIHTTYDLSIDGFPTKCITYDFRSPTFFVALFLTYESSFVGVFYTAICQNLHL